MENEIQLLKYLGKIIRCEPKLSITWNEIFVVIEISLLVDEVENSLRGFFKDLEGWENIGLDIRIKVRATTL